MNKKTSKPYTLVEIMMVIVIAAILFGIGIPAFSTMIQGNSMTIAIRQLGAKIQAARAYAVMNRCSVALLMIQNSGTKDDNLYSAYRVCEVDDSNNFESWIEDENWKLLPKGILRYTVEGPETKTIAADKDPVFFTSGSNVNVYALVFKKDGKATTSCIIKLRHGRYVSNNLIWTDGDNRMTTNLTINQYTGKSTITTEDL